MYLPHSAATSFMCWASARLFPSSASRTPSVLHALNGSSHGNCMILLPKVMLMLPGSSMFNLYFHCWFCHLKLIRYQKHLSGTRLPPVALSNLCHIASEHCSLLLTLSITLLASLTIKLVSSTNASPASALCCGDSAQMKAATIPSCLMISNNGVLTAAQICGPTPLPSPIPATPLCHVSYPCANTELPKAVLTWWLRCVRV